jgi:hypothetical protein
MPNGCCRPGDTCDSGDPVTGQLCLFNLAASQNSATNYLLTNRCSPIKGLSVEFFVTQNLISPNGFTLQLNAYNPKGPLVSWMQYVLLATSSSLLAQVQYWDMGAFNKCGGGPSCVNPTTQLVNLASTLGSPFANTLYEGSRLKIELANDDSGNVTAAIFTYTDSTANTTSQRIPLPSSFQFPVVAFQANLVGPDGGADVQFQLGAGTITYKSDSQLCLEGNLPDQCSNSTGSNTPTAETSNAKYGTMTKCCGSQLTQSLTTV